MATKLDREWVKHGAKAHATVSEHLNALVLEVERLEALQEKKDAALTNIMKNLGQLRNDDIEFICREALK